MNANLAIALKLIDDTIADAASKIDGLAVLRNSAQYRISNGKGNSIDARALSYYDARIAALRARGIELARTRSYLFEALGQSDEPEQPKCAS